MNRWLGSILVAVVALGTISAAPQKTPVPPGPPEEEVIDTEISEMLGAWQIGDFTMMKNYYADDVIVVSGVWEPALVGWAKYLQGFMRQRERVTSVRLDRSNSFIRVAGNFAWATYLWDFSAKVDGTPTDAHGQATLIFQKRDGRWLIVHNHNSIIGEARPQQAAPAQQPPPKPGA